MCNCVVCGSPRPALFDEKRGLTSQLFTFGADRKILDGAHNRTAGQGCQFQLSCGFCPPANLHLILDNKGAWIAVFLDQDIFYGDQPSGVPAGCVKVSKDHFVSLTVG